MEAVACQMGPCLNASSDDLVAKYTYPHDYDRIGNKKYQEDLQTATGSELYGYRCLGQVVWD